MGCFSTTLLPYQHQKVRDEKSTSKNARCNSFWFIGIEKVLTAMCCSGVTPLLPCPSQSSYIFERNPSKVKSMQIKDVRLVRGLDSITHSFIHTSVHFQGTPRVCQEPGSQKEKKTAPILGKPTVLCRRQRK